MSLLLAGVTPTFSQQQRGKIYVIAKPSKDKIQLRWGPDNDVAWQYLVKNGVTIERITISRNNTILPLPERLKLTSQPLKPWPASAWQPRVENDDYFAIGAQSLYGDDFSVINQKKGNSDVVEMMNMSKQQELRFSFLLFVADQSFEVAKAAALGFEDGAVRPGERYLYRIYPSKALPIKIDTGFVYIGTDEKYELPQPLDLKATFSDKVVSLSWNKVYHERIYNSYIVEKSEDEGKSFNPINKLPFVMTMPERTQSSPYMYRSDSLAQNNKRYVYRVIGIDAFGEKGPPSETISGMGKGKSSFQVQINRSEVINNQQIRVEWTLEPQSKQGEVTKFKLFRSNSVTGKYEVVKDNIASSNSNFTDASPRPTNYYMVSAFTSDGQTINSFPVLVQLEDSIPPSSPLGLTGIVDTAGMVRLQWRANTEDDLVGYRVYRSNYKSSEYSQVTHTFLKGANYQDTINVLSLDKKVYYKITALDTRYNESKFSTILELDKPDKIAPVPPVFTNILNSYKRVKLEWKRSSSNDVKEQLLYRKEGTGSWQPLRNFPVDTVTFQDKSVQPSTQYQYRIIAVDAAGNKSVVSKDIMIRTQAETDHLQISTLTAVPDRTGMKIALGWEYPSWNNIQKFCIYRSSAGEPLSLYKSLPATSRGFNDAQVKMATSYQYRIKVIFKDGTETPFSKEVGVSF
ncbi:fibronectin type III domain-containing protein [Ohtaekwangia koreensis]|nr:hypothetical protein [Ohtaekwangia koreensis]